MWPHLWASYTSAYSFPHIFHMFTFPVSQGLYHSLGSTFINSHSDLWEIQPCNKLPGLRSFLKTWHKPPWHTLPSCWLLTNPAPHRWHWWVWLPASDISCPLLTVAAVTCLCWGSWTWKQRMEVNKREKNEDFKVYHIPSAPSCWRKPKYLVWTDQIDSTKVCCLCNHWCLNNSP